MKISILLLTVLFSMSTNVYAGVVRITKGSVMNIAGPTFGDCDYRGGQHEGTAFVSTSIELTLNYGMKVQIARTFSEDWGLMSRGWACKQARQEGVIFAQEFLMKLNEINLGDVLEVNTENPALCRREVMDIMTGSTPQTTTWKTKTIINRCL